MTGEEEDEARRALDAETRRSLRREAAALAELHARAQALTPYLVGTTLLVVANVLVFGVMFGAGVDVLSPPAASLIAWGANYGPRVAGGQWWRLFTSMFVHVGPFHLAMNMWALFSVGRFIERTLGTVTFLAVYLLSGWASALVSSLTHPFTPSAGASGAVFGLFGVLVAVVFRPRATMPIQALRPMRSSVVFFSLFNLWLGLTTPIIDLAAHLGGLVFGFVCGAVLNHELTVEARRAVRKRTAGFTTVAIMALGAATYLLQGTVPDLEAVLDQWQAAQERAVGAYDVAAKKAEAGELSDDDFAAAIERDVLLPWNAARAKLAVLRNLPPKQRDVVRDLQRYQRLRAEGWQMMAHGLREHDADQIQRGAEKHRHASELTRRFGKDD